MMKELVDRNINDSGILISIIIPVYNVQDYLDDCILSILNQNSSGFEIILIDDGSKDNSGFLCDKYSQEYSFIYSFHQNNGGTSSARNKGISLANGKYVYFLDSDDKMAPNFLNNLKNRIILDNNITVDVYVCQHLENGDSKKAHINIEHEEYCSGELMLKSLIKSNKLFISPPKYVANREYILKNNLFFYEGIVSEDELWVPQILLLARRTCFVNFCSYDYIRREGSVSSTITDLKRGASNIRTSTEKWKLYQEYSFEDINFKNQLLSSCVTIFLKGVISSFYGKCDKNDREFIKKYWYITKYIKTKEQKKLYRKAIYLYFRIYIFNKIF